MGQDFAAVSVFGQCVHKSLRSLPEYPVRCSGSRKESNRGSSEKKEARKGNAAHTAKEEKAHIVVSQILLCL